MNYFHLQSIRHIQSLQGERRDSINLQLQDLSTRELLIKVDVAEADFAAVLEADGDVEGVDSSQVQPQHHILTLLDLDATNLEVKIRFNLFRTKRL